MRDDSFVTETSRTVQLNKRVICFGDSNTYGVVAKWQQDGKPSDRYNEITRWPRVMQSCLGEKWEAIEEGMPGRTTIYSNTHIADYRQEFYKTASEKSVRLVISTGEKRTFANILLTIGVV